MRIWGKRTEEEVSGASVARAALAGGSHEAFGARSTACAHCAHPQPAAVLLEPQKKPGLRLNADQAEAELQNVIEWVEVHAPVVVIGPAEKRGELAGLIEAGATDFVERKTNALAEARGRIQERLRQAPKEIESAPNSPDEAGEEDFGGVLRHELNNPLTGILGNAELLLAEIRRKKDGKVPGGGEQRLEIIATLAVRLRETVRRLSEKWEAQKNLAP